MLSHIRSSRSRWVNDASKAKSFSFGWFKARKQHFATNASSQFLVISPEVEEAIKSGNPVVSLESTIVAHGMPYPQNLEMAWSVEEIIRSKGVVPATIALKGDKVHVGLDNGILTELAQSENCKKLTTRDLPKFLADGQKNPNQFGATTVASTMHISNMAGIKTFVTGGSGGVHRGSENTMDISADLTELSRTPVCCICAGIKSILDIEKTLEVLETMSVPTLVWKSDKMPAFYSGSRSDISAPSVIQSASEVADMYWWMRSLDLNSGMLLAVPSISDSNKNVKSQEDGEKIENAIEQALQESFEKAKELKGRDITPYLLRRVAELTGGLSLKRNIELVKNNAEVGAEVAIEIARRVKTRGDVNVFTSDFTVNDEKKKNDRKNKVIVCGGAVIDLVAKPSSSSSLLSFTSNPGICTESKGGVGRNIAETLGRLGSSPIFYSAIGDDARGTSILQHLESECNVYCDQNTVTKVPGCNTATYLAVLDETGDLNVAIADMDVLLKIKTPSSYMDHVQYLVLDANLPLETLVSTASGVVNANKKRDNKENSDIKILFEPTSIPKARIAASSNFFLSSLTYCTPNKDELFAMAESSGWKSEEHSKTTGDEKMKEAADYLLGRMKKDSPVYLIITLGKDGVLLASTYNNNNYRDRIEYEYFSSSIEQDIQNCTGAGDTLCGAFIHSLLNGMSESDAVRSSIDAAILSIQSSFTISPMLSDISDTK